MNEINLENWDFDLGTSDHHHLVSTIILLLFYYFSWYGKTRFSCWYIKTRQALKCHVYKATSNVSLTAETSQCHGATARLCGRWVVVCSRILPRGHLVVSTSGDLFVLGQFGRIFESRIFPLILWDRWLPYWHLLVFSVSFICFTYY